MNKRTTLPLVVLVAVVGLVLGSFGTATAAGITAKQVKKIATKAANKAIKKKASSLSVASAANAGNATNLAGKPASAYQDTAAVYTVDQQTPTSDLVGKLPVGPGSYLFTLSTFLDGSGDDDAECIVYAQNPTTFDYLPFVDEGHYSQQYEGSFSGAGVGTVPAGYEVFAECFSQSDDFVTYSPITVGVVPLDAVTTTAIAPQAKPAKGHPAQRRH